MLRSRLGPSSFGGRTRCARRSGPHRNHVVRSSIKGATPRGLYAGSATHPPARSGEQTDPGRRVTSSPPVHGNAVATVLEDSPAAGEIAQIAPGLRGRHHTNPSARHRDIVAASRPNCARRTGAHRHRVVGSSIERARALREVPHWTTRTVRSNYRPWTTRHDVATGSGDAVVTVLEGAPVTRVITQLDPRLRVRHRAHPSARHRDMRAACRPNWARRAGPRRLRVAGCNIEGARDLRTDRPSTSAAPGVARRTSPAGSTCRCQGPSARTVSMTADAASSGPVRACAQLSCPDSSVVRRTSRTRVVRRGSDRKRDGLGPEHRSPPSV